MTCSESETIVISANDDRSSGRAVDRASPGPQPAAQGPRRKRRLQRWLGENPLGLALSTPYVFFVLIVFIIPFGFGIWMSVHDFFFTAPGVQVDHPFVGLDNFKEVLGDPAVRAAFWHILVFMAINIPLTVTLGLILGMALNSVTRWRGFFRVAYYVPYVTASVATITVWIFMFNSSGVINRLLGSWAPSPSWFGNETLVMPLVAIYVTWKQLGFYILLYLAALQNVPQELSEAARTDGANSWQVFRAVTWPAVRPVTSLVVLLSIVLAGQLFTEPYLLTGGGPNGASSTPAFLLYQKGIQQGQPDTAAAIGILLVILVLGIALLSRRFTERE